MKNDLYIEKLNLKNIGVYENVNITFSKLSVFSAMNEKGKTTLLNAIKSLLGGGHTKELLRIGQDKGIIELILSDGSKIIKNITQKTYSVKAFDYEGKEIKRAQTAFIDKIYDDKLIDPAVLFDKSPAEQLGYIYNILPMDIPKKEIIKVIDPVKHIVLPDNEPEERDAILLANGAEGLELIQDIANVIRASIKVNNKIVYKKRNDNRTLASTLISTDNKYDANEYNNINKELINEQSEKEAQLIELKNSHETNMKKIEIEKLEALQEIEQVYNDKKMKEVQGNSESLQKVHELYDTKINNFKDIVASMEADKKIFDSQKDTKKKIEENTNDIEVSENETAYLNEILFNYNTMKNEYIKKIPIEGLELGSVLKAGKDVPALLYEGVPLNNINRSTKARLLCNIAVLNAEAGKISTTIFDNLEMMDKKNKLETLKIYNDNGIQFIGLAVKAEGSFSVEQFDKIINEL